jgi:hypothetical protein
MKHSSLWIIGVAGALASCQPQLPFTEGNGERTIPQVEEQAAAPSDVPRAETESGMEREIDIRALAVRPQGEETVCRTFARKVAEAALQHGDDVGAFMADLQNEFIGGTDNPFDMKRGLSEGRWNRRYFYAGHGGFRPEYDDAQRYPRGGNHQPGHFISVFSIAQQFGEEQARIAIAAAGDYDPGDEDDLRLSMFAIPLGAGLRDGTVTTAEVAQRVRELCRS